MSNEATAPAALTMLTEEEVMFRDAVRDFAQGEIQPKVEEMDKAHRYDESVIKSLFEIGVMACESPEEFGGAGGSFFQAILAVEEISRVDPSVGVLVDVHNTLGFIVDLPGRKRVLQ